MITHPHLESLYHTAKKLGLTATDVSPKKNFGKVLIQNKAKMYVASGASFFPDIQRWVPKLMNDKALTQKVLENKGYNVVKTEAINPTLISSEKKYTEKIKSLSVPYPAIIKPNGGLQGRGIVFLTNQAELLRATKSLYKNNKKFLIQPVIWDDEYRITLIANKPVMVHKKKLPSITGDGQKTIEKLLQKQPKTLKGENFIKWNLEQHKVSLDTVLNKGEQFETHIIKKRTPEYYKASGFPKEVVSWGKKLLKDVSTTTVAIDFVAPDGLHKPETFIIFEINANPAWRYVFTELGDKETFEKISEHILTSYFGKK